MAPKKPPQKTPEERFLEPLAALAARQPEIEALIFQGDAGDWPDTPSDVLESEEIAYWAEGLIPEGFRLEWRIMAAEGEKGADHIRIYAWEEGAPPPEPAAGDRVLGRARWPEDPAG